MSFEWLTGDICLFTGLSTASLRQNRLPLDLRLVIGVDRVGYVQSPLQVLAAAGVKHRPLFSINDFDHWPRQESKGKTYKGGSLGRNPRDEDDLRSARVNQGQFTAPPTPVHQLDYIIPLALTGKLILDVVDGITRGGVTLVVAGGFELVAENFIVGFLRGLIKNDLLLVFGDLEDNELGLVSLGVAAHAEAVVSVKDILLDGDTNGGSLSSV